MKDILLSESELETKIDSFLRRKNNEMHVRELQRDIRTDKYDLVVRYDALSRFVGAN